MHRPIRTVAGALCAAALVVAGCGGDDDVDAAADAAADQADESPVDTDAGDSDDDGEVAEDSGDERESPYEIDDVAPVDQGMATLTLDGVTYQFLDIDPDDDRDNQCSQPGQGEPQIDATLSMVDDAGEVVYEAGSDTFANVLFVDLPFDPLFTPELSFNLDDARWSTANGPDEVGAGFIEWGLSTDRNHAEGMVVMVNETDGSTADARFSITCPAA